MSEAAPRKGWTRVAFGDVVRLSRERSGDPEGDGFDRYVGLDHIEPGDLKIRRWGEIGDGTTFTNVFRAGQVLFGKRRAYQRKVAVADFDGVCSGDIYVFEPRNQQLLPELLPFICQTDGFFEHAVGTSAGSLSPRTNWESLASYEFDLPSLEEQRRIADLLDACEDLINSHLVLAAEAEMMYRAWSFCTLAPRIKSASDCCNEASTRAGWVWRRVEECFDLQLGKMSSKAAREGPEQTNYIKNNNVLWNRFVLEDLPQMSFSALERRKFLLCPDDLLVCEGGEIGRCAIWTDVGREVVYQKALHRLRPRDGGVVPRSFLHYLRYCATAGELDKIATGTSILHLPQESLGALRLPFPDRETQVSIAGQLDTATDAAVRARERAEGLRGVKSMLMERVLAP